MRGTQRPRNSLYTVSRRRRMMLSVLTLACAAGAFVAAQRAHAQTLPPHVQAERDTMRDDRGFSFTGRGPYRASVPTPASLLGYDIGERNTQYADQQRVLQAIAAAATDRVRVEPIGVTAEGRRMHVFLVSSPANIARLENIRRDLDRIADPRGASTAEVESAVSRVPAVVWISESIHGNESPGFESAMALLYQLAASEEPATLAMLDNTLLVLNPSANPDGHERFTVWYHSVAMSNPDNGSYEHSEPWSVQGRFNHYRFDMNRDLIAISQRETRAMTGAMLRWHPMVAIDQHGHTVNYFFPPAARPVNEQVRPEARKWLDVFGKANAAAFDRYGWMYFVRSDFDLYYPGYFDTWPSLTGATGMTFETDGGGWKGMLWQRDDGSFVSLRDGVSKHFVTAMATLEAVGARHTERVRDYLAARQGAVTDGRASAMRRVMVTPGNDPARAAEFAAALLRAGIEVQRADAPFRAARAHAYADNGVSARQFPAGSYIVDLAQPQGKLAKSLLEPDPAIDSVFVRTQFERFGRNVRRGDGGVQEGYEFYDVTAWSLPVAYGVEAYWTEDATPVTGSLLASAPDTVSTVNGERLPHAIASGIHDGARARSAYLFTPVQTGARALAYHLLARGFRVGVGQRGFEAGGREWPRGTFVVRTTRNSGALHDSLQAISVRHGVLVHAVNSAMTEQSQFGIGDGEIVNLELPRIAVLGDEGIAQTSFGALWWTMEERYAIPFTHLGWNRLGDLSRFNVIIIPDGSAGALGTRLGKGESLRAWVQRGGTLITFGDATQWAIREEANLTSARRNGSAKAATGDSATAKPVTGARASSGGAESEDQLLAVTSPGANPSALQAFPDGHYDARLDLTHWLTFGHDQQRLTALFGGRATVSLASTGTNVAVFAPIGTLRRAGFTFPGNTEAAIRNSALLVEEPLGSGHVVLFANDPTFRGWWRALDRLLFNAVLLGPAY
jgi:hypothetical protein